MCVLKWVYIQFLKPLRNQSNKSSNSSKSLRPSIKVSVWTFHRHKPKQVMSVTRLKFSRCMCESCINPKMKVARLNMFLTEKCESVKELLKESVCELQGGIPNLVCIDRKRAQHGVEGVGKRLEQELGGDLTERGWSKWELVKVGKSSQMEKVKKTGGVQECLAELLHELNPLYRHVFSSEWQRSQLQALKAILPEGWAIATCDFAENFLSFRMSLRVPTGHTNR